MNPAVVLEGLGASMNRYGRMVKWLVDIEKEMVRHYWRHEAVYAEKRHEDLAKHYAEWAKSLTSLLQENGGTWVKVGQFLSCRPDLLPPEFIHELSHLQTNVRSVPFEQIYPVLTEQWGNRWESQFACFDVVPRHTASIAQVYKARLQCGERVAVKVLLPGVQTGFNHDARVLRLLAKGFNRLARGLDWVAVTEQFIEMTQYEFDLSAERRNIQRFAAKTVVSDVVIPSVYPEMSGDRVLVMTWLEGEPLSHFLSRKACTPDDKMLCTVLERMVRIYIRHIAMDGLFHADPHPGNMLVMPEGRLGLLDFGAIGELPTAQRQAFNALLAMLFGYQSPAFSELWAWAGFTGITCDIMNQGAQVIRKTEQAADLGEVLDALLATLRNGRVDMPGSFVAVVRVLITVSGLRVDGIEVLVAVTVGGE
ncbi:MAG: AarF/UbiB family protein [Gammaproteobacteria bacterium]